MISLKPGKQQANNTLGTSYTHTLSVNISELLASYFSTLREKKICDVSLVHLDLGLKTAEAADRNLFIDAP